MCNVLEKHKLEKQEAVGAGLKRVINEMFLCHRPFELRNLLPLNTRPTDKNKSALHNAGINSIKKYSLIKKKTHPVTDEIEHFRLLVFPGADVSGGKVGGGRQKAMHPSAGADAAHQQRAQPQHFVVGRALAEVESECD